MAESAPLFADVIRSRAMADPQAAALTHEHASLTYSQLQARIDDAARHLWNTAGVRPGDRVAWLGFNDPALIVLLFACARIGAVLLPLNIRLAPPEWAAQLTHCGPKLIVHDGSWQDAARDLAGRHGMEALQCDAILSGSGEPAPNHASSDAPVLLVFTSGTTGTPKAAVHTQANLLANMRIAAQAQEMRADDRVLTVLPLFHVGGLCIQTLPALSCGAHVVLHSRFAPDACLDAIEQQRPTLTLQVPATMKALIDHPRWATADLASLRAVWAGSSVIPPPLVHAFHARGLAVCNVYGATETGPFSIALGPAHALAKAGSCGWPAAGVEARLGSSRGDAAEVLVRGPNVVRHYWPQQPACDADGWFHTGDLARQDVDGSYTIVGRARDLIIAGGENIHPAEVEDALASHPGVLECAAFGVPDAEWGEIVAMAVVPRSGTSIDAAELRAHLQGRIARYKIPRRWLMLDALPRTALGKVQRSDLTRRFAG